MGKKTPSIEKLDIYSQSIIDEIFDMSDKDILTETNENNSADETVDFIKSIYEKVKSNIGKTRLTAARFEIKQRSTNITKNSASVVNIENARRLLKNINDNDNSLSQNITLAARNLDALSDEEILSLYSDLVELGILDDENFE